MSTGTGIERKIKQILKELQAANDDYMKRFILPLIKGQGTVVNDYFEVSYAQDKISSLEVQLQLYLSEKKLIGSLPRQSPIYKKKKLALRKE